MGMEFTVGGSWWRGYDRHGSRLLLVVMTSGGGGGGGIKCVNDESNNGINKRDD